MNDNEFKQNMKNLVNALQNVCRAYSEIPDILEFEGRLSTFDKKFESMDKGDMTLLLGLLGMKIESGEIKTSLDSLGYSIANAIDRLEYLLAKEDVREFLQGYFQGEGFPNPVEDYVRAVMKSIRERDDSEDIITVLKRSIDGISDERAKEVADKIDILKEFKLLTHHYGWNVKERYKEYIENALEEYE